MGGCVLGMGSRLRGNGGSLGAGTTDVWGWLRVGDGFPPSRERGSLGAGTTDVWGWLRVGDGFPPSREWRMFGGGNDGCLGVAACWGWIPAFAGDGSLGAGRMFGGGCVLGMGSRLRGNDGSLGAGTTDFTVTVIPVETGIQARGGVVDGVGGCGILPASRYSFPFSRQVSRPSFRACSRQPRRRAAPDLPDLRSRFPKPSPRRTSVRRHGASWDGFSGAA